MIRTGDSEEKISKAKGNAGKDAEVGRPDGTAVQEAADAVDDSKAEQGKPVDGKPSSWLVRVKNNPGFCGIGAGGIQFANGKAMTASARIAEGNYKSRLPVQGKDEVASVAHNFNLMARIFFSWKQSPMSCRPTGIPFPSKPQGTLIPGSPARFTEIV